MSFDDDIETGRLGEEKVIRFLTSRGYSVRRTGQDENGRWFSPDGAGDYTAPDLVVDSHINGGDKPLVGKALEVKTDRIAHETGNICLEVYSNVGTGRRGWVYSDYGGYLGYLCLGDGILYIAKTDAIKKKLEESWHRFRPAQTLVNKFTAISLLIPRAEFEKICLWSGRI